ncbi:FMN-binding negative transcriptional regulator [Pseudoalteromonas luteoviolacea]|uniref:FMN-binding negative transcriptional regulator n=1 Tax=Pseudoalteromonas luteoviolacea TaxID=43657 RepID=UPI001F3042C8|nr:FMN-binding negative transcriptional regulator [Pseudoalteromonas luteoviolacea]MCF6439797.1 FMN-binding negative transcriptional regulator [Pseudoalteromonas luteoviolacea]
MKYPFKEYVQQQDSALFDVIQRFPLATFFCKSEDQTHICHIPVSLCKGSKTLFGHATGSNPIKHFVGTTVDIVFRGPDTYLSPNQVEGLSLPTWDYVTVQGQGKLISIEDYDKQLEVMGHILQAFEDKRNPWQLTAVPEKRLKSMCKSLLFFEIKLEALSGNFKLSQNKTAETRAGIADLLSNTNPEMRSYYE